MTLRWRECEPDPVRAALVAALLPVACAELNLRVKPHVRWVEPSDTGAIITEENWNGWALFDQITLASSLPIEQTARVFFHECAHTEQFLGSEHRRAWPAGSWANYDGPMKTLCEGAAEAIADRLADKYADLIRNFGFQEGRSFAGRQNSIKELSNEHLLRR
jgi:hypothetical protein